MAYEVFLLIGLVTFRYHWHILFDVDRGGFIQPYVEALLVVPPLALVACACTLGSDDKMLRLVAIATVVVISLQVLLSLIPISRPATDIILALGRVYTVICFVA